MAQRVTLRKRQPYNTVSNRRRVVKTPGGKLVVHHLKKKAVSIYRISLGLVFVWVPVGRRELAKGRNGFKLLERFDQEVL